MLQPRIKSGGTAGKQSRSGKAGMPLMVRKHDGIGKGEEGMKVAMHPSIAVPHCLLGNKIGNNENHVKRWKHLHGSLKKINKYS
jgi:hypothetical protein